jgi:hypothetical protein
LLLAQGQAWESQKCAAAYVSLSQCQWDALREANDLHNIESKADVARNDSHARYKVACKETVADLADTEEETCWNLKKYYYTVNVKAKAKRHDHSILTCELAFGRLLSEEHPVFGRLPSRRNRLAIQTGMEAAEVQEEYVEGEEDEDSKVSDICSVFAFCIHLAP